MTRRLFALLTLFALLITAPAMSLVNGEEPAKEDKAYDAVCAFSRTNWLTEARPAKTTHNWYGAAVLIAPDVVLTARHLLNNSGREQIREGEYMVRFRRHADGTLGSRKEGHNSYHQVRVMKWIPAKGSDLALGILEKPVEHIDPVPMLLADEVIVERRAMLAGWGSESKWRGQKNPRTALKVGENKVSSANTFLRILSYEVETRENKQGQRGSYIIDENAVPNMHDSGGSIFVFGEDDKPHLAGIIATYNGGSWLPAAAKAGYPLEAASQGAKALLEAVKKQEAEEQKKKEQDAKGAA